MNYFLPNHVYDILKWAGLIACPVLATFIGKVGPAWGMPNVDAIVLTINATGVCIGGLIGASAVTAKQTQTEE